MLEKLHVEGFRILREFSWNLNEGANILVGANSAGKSTILDSVELVIRGGLNGIRAYNALAPDWFNADDVDEFFKGIVSGETPKPPTITISAVFSDSDEMAAICGCNGPEGPKEDAPGLFIRFCVPQELTTEFLQESKSIADTASKKFIPVEYYECEWRSFKGEKLVKRPTCVTCTRINVRPEPYSKAVDSYARNLVESELTDEQLRGIAKKIREAHTRIDDDILREIKIQKTGRGKRLGLQLDKSPRSDWKNTIVLEKDGLPFSALGSAEQILAKCAIALERSAETSIVLLEEPECHLSHTSLRELLSFIDSSLGSGQQALITTHSPFVLNRLGLDKMSLVAVGTNPERVTSLNKDTVRYFKRISGYDTLRIVLAKKAVLVEGPTDEMVFTWAFKKARGFMPEEKGIDIIEYGIRYKRAFELAAAIGKTNTIALRDNDGKNEDYWQEAVETFESEDRKLFVGHADEGPTIEPQMVKANLANLPELAQATGAPVCDETGLVKYLLKHKVEWSLNLLEADGALTDKLNAPRFIEEAINQIDPPSSNIGQ